MFLFIYSNVHTLFGPLLSPPSPPPTLIPGRTCSALSSNFVEENTSNNKKEKVFFLVQIRIAIQRDS
jgi:hypothetical protein